MHTLLICLLSLITVDEDSFKPSYEPGSKCRLGTKDQKYVVVADGYIWSRRLEELVAANDSTGVQEMVDKGRAFLLEPQSSAQIIKKSGNWFEVRVLSGTKSGVAVYVHTSYMRPPATPKEIEVEKKAEAVKREGKRKEQKKADAAKAEQMKRDAEEKREATEQRDKERIAAEEEKAAELLKHAKRWLNEGDKELATRRLDELLKRFPRSRLAPEAKKLRDDISRKP